MTQVTIYAPYKTNRLLYVLDWLFKEQLGISYQLTDNTENITGTCISYGQTIAGAWTIPDSGLLWEQGVKEHDIAYGKWNTLPVIYAKEDAGYALPFDIFSALFFLLSRYEEYYAYTPDRHDRYPATASIAYKQGWLRRPLVDEWVAQFGKLLSEKFHVPIKPRAYSYIPTYDIDIAFSYRYKGWKRTAGALAKDLIGGKISKGIERLKTVGGKLDDPYDSYDAISKLHHHQPVKPLFFVLSALRITAHDKNIAPFHPAMVALVKRLNDIGQIGIHPSYYSNTRGILPEKQLLENNIGHPILISRQHYIRIDMRATYQQLIKVGITDDYSMGYGTHLGFRAGTGQSFLWYDVANECSTPLRLHPFCFMDTTALYDEGMNAGQAFAVLDEMNALLKQTNSQLITIFHNFSLGSSEEWKGWREMYEQYPRPLKG
ncbi:MAG: hypothetical protein H0X33_03390 [Taibaiella sp.]|nr:hypothetical protein [Taibaiella sp.]